MSCNGCRVLRKGCSESCVLRPCLQWIETAESQGHATVFVAKFFGRAGLMSFISAVPESQRPALFQSLLFEACGRTINPINGAVGLLWTGNWNLCQEAVETVLRGGSLQPLPDFDGVELVHGRMKKRKVDQTATVIVTTPLKMSSACDLDLSLSSPRSREGKQRPTTPSEGSVTTTMESGLDRTAAAAPRLLNLFM